MLIIVGRNEWQVIASQLVNEDRRLVTAVELNDSGATQGQLPLVALRISDDYERILQDLREEFWTNKFHFFTSETKATPEAFFFDMDGTVIAQETIVELARCVGKEVEVAAITEAAMRGEMDFEDALRARVNLLRGLSVTCLNEIARDRLKINPGIRELCAFGLKNKIPMFLISGGFDFAATHIASELGLSGFLANKLEVKDSVLTGSTDGFIIDANAKKEFVLSQQKALHLDLKNSFCFGDGANDIPMLSLCGNPVGVSPKPILAAHLNSWVFPADVTFILRCLRVITSQQI